MVNVHYFLNRYIFFSVFSRLNDILTFLTLYSRAEYLSEYFNILVYKNRIFNAYIYLKCFKEMASGYLTKY